MAFAAKSRYEAVMQISLFEIALLLAAAAIAAPIAKWLQVGTVLGYLLAGITKDKLALHDMIAGTCVVKAPPKTQE